MTLNIQPIKLLAGFHSQTAETGQGCFMNVVSYLNGEDQITDDSPCVCSLVKFAIIAINDLSDDADRQRMIPLISRAMGSTTDNPVEIHRRIKVIENFNAKLTEFATSNAYPKTPWEVNILSGLTANENLLLAVQKSADFSTPLKMQLSLESTGVIIGGAVRGVTALVNKILVNVLSGTVRLQMPDQLSTICLNFLDAVLPPDSETIKPEVVTRAAKLVELATA